MKNKIIALIKRAFSNVYIRTISLGIGVGIVALLLLTIFLNIKTRHGQSFMVPDFRGKTSAEVHKLARKKNLRIEITDSVYIMNRVPGSVIDQTPMPSTQVKKNRRIFLIINAQNPIKVKMPNLVGYTLRQAKAILEQDNLEIGHLSFKPDMGVNNVLQQIYHGSTIEAGTMIPKGSKVELVLGRGFDNRTNLPLLIGQKLNDAKNQIIEASLNVGKIKFDETIKDYKDSLDARVYSQYPAYSIPNDISFGANVNIWLTLNQNRIPQVKRDSLSKQYQFIQQEGYEEEITD